MKSKNWYKGLTATAITVAMAGAAFTVPALAIEYDLSNGDVYVDGTQSWQQDESGKEFYFGYNETEGSWSEKTDGRYTHTNDMNVDISAGTTTSAEDSTNGSVNITGTTEGLDINIDTGTVTNTAADGSTVTTGSTIDVTLDNMSNDKGLDITGSGTVNIELDGTNTIDVTESVGTSDSQAAIGVDQNASVNIQDKTGTEGTLNAEGNAGAAGIGGDEGQNAGNITITGGTVNATGGSGGAGIGSGMLGTVGDITINGGTVTAEGTGMAAGIGGGGMGKVDDITINDGTVVATGSDGGAGIGGGGSMMSTTGTITINGGDITASGVGLEEYPEAAGGAGIGGGIWGSNGEILITGGEIDATGAYGAAGIGSGSGGTSDNISISGGTVTANGGMSGAGIGSGADGSTGNITISSGKVDTMGGTDAAGIGTGLAGTVYNIHITGDADVTAKGFDGEFSEEEEPESYIGVGIGAAVGSNVKNTSVGSITIEGDATVNAYGSYDPWYGRGVAIGAGLDATIGSIELGDNAEIHAYGGAANYESNYTDLYDYIYVYGNSLYDGKGTSSGIGASDNGSIGSIVIRDQAYVDANAMNAEYYDEYYYDPHFDFDKYPEVKYLFKDRYYVIDDIIYHYQWDGKAWRREKYDSKYVAKYEYDEETYAEKLVIVDSTTGEVFESIDIQYKGENYTGNGIGTTTGGKITTIDIRDNSTVDATGGLGGAGIGASGNGSEDSLSKIGSINISGNAQVTAEGGTFAAGIGTGRNDAIDVEDPENGYNSMVSGTAPDANKNLPVMVDNITITGNARVDAYGGQDGAAIGSGYGLNSHVGTITIGTNNENDSQPTVHAQGAESAESNGKYYHVAAIGSGRMGRVDQILIYNGEVNAFGGENSAGIGSGFGGTVGSVVIENGTVNATGGGSGAGIGSGYFAPITENGEQICRYDAYVDLIQIKGGEITATSGNNGAGIGAGSHYSKVNKLVIEGGEITAAGGKNSAGIGAGSSFSDVASIQITGGDIKAYGGSASAGIGAGYSSNSRVDQILIQGGNIYAEGQKYGAGVGSGRAGVVGSIEITGGTLTAQGGERASGIGAGGYSKTYNGVVDTVTIGGNAHVTATGGLYGSGIGASYYGKTGTVTIEDDAVVYAYGASHAAGIGTGWRGTLDGIYIKGGSIEAYGGQNGAAIGSGWLQDGLGEVGSIEMTGGNTYAVGGLGASAIGGGANSLVGSITITDDAIFEAYADGTKFAVDISDGIELNIEHVLNGRFEENLLSKGGEAQFTQTDAAGNVFVYTLPYFELEDGSTQTFRSFAGHAADGVAHVQNTDGKYDYYWTDYYNSEDDHSRETFDDYTINGGMLNADDIIFYERGQVNYEYYLNGELVHSTEGAPFKLHETPYYNQYEDDFNIEDYQAATSEYDGVTYQYVRTTDEKGNGSIVYTIVYQAEVEEPEPPVDPEPPVIPEYPEIPDYNPPEVDIDDPDVPLVEEPEDPEEPTEEIDDEETPLTPSIPDEVIDEIIAEIEDEVTPLTSVPKTGAEMPAATAALPAGVLAAAVAMLVRRIRRKG